MANEIYINGRPSGENLYARFRESAIAPTDAAHWNSNPDTNAGNFGDLPEIGTTGQYASEDNLGAVFSFSGKYIVSIYKRIGSTPAPTDTWLKDMEILWDGTKEVTALDAFLVAGQAATSAGDVINSLVNSFRAIALQSGNAVAINEDEWDPATMSLQAISQKLGAFNFNATNQNTVLGYLTWMMGQGSPPPQLDDDVVARNIQMVLDGQSAGASTSSSSALDSGTIQQDNGNTVTLDASAAVALGAYENCLLCITGNPGAKQTRRIKGYDPESKKASISPFRTNVTGAAYEILPMATVKFTG